METKHLELKLKQNIKNEFIVTAIAPLFVWRDGKPTDVVAGWKLRTVCPSAQYAETTVKMEADNPPLEADAVEKEPVLVAFEGLEFTPYISMNGKSIAYSAKAKSLKVMKLNTN